MKRRIILSCTCLVLTLSLLPGAALGAGLSQVRDPVVFSDVAQDWSQPYISQCYALGLMSGTGADTFSPSGTLSVAEAVTVAVRLADLYGGGGGVVSQEGDNWYDGAVAQATQLGILSQGQFDSYTRPATRAELAGLLGRALPEDAYTAINTITTLPDVNSATPYSQEIFRLYNAGVLTGSDAYGTFHPQQSITRAELAATLCRLALPDTRVSFTPAPKPADTTVYTTGRKLYIDGALAYGIVEINGAYYIPTEVLSDRNLFPNWKVEFQEAEDYYSLELDPFYGEVHVNGDWSTPPAGQVMGKAELSSKPLRVDKEDIPGSVYTLGGRYPMLSLSALGAVEQGGNFYLSAGSDPTQYTLVVEDDLAGGPVPTLLRDTTRETVTAIHDYLVNTLTYSPWVSAPSSMSGAAREAAYAVYEQATQKYSLENNISLSSKYGICQNYAELFQTMCTRAGIPCIIVTGVGSGDSHAWNMVYVDGQWLYVDCTFDDPISSTPVLDYDYCMVGPDVMVLRHYWDGDDYPMPDTYDPAWESLDTNNITSADMFRKCLVAQLAQHKTSFSLRVTASGAYGGTGCIYAYPESQHWFYFSGGYNRSTGTYDYKVQYW